MTKIDLKAYYLYVTELTNYRTNFETLAEEARQACNWDISMACLLQAIRLHGAIFQLEEALRQYTASEGTTTLPTLDKIWS